MDEQSLNYEVRKNHIKSTLKLLRNIESAVVTQIGSSALVQLFVIHTNNSI